MLPFTYYQREPENSCSTTEVSGLRKQHRLVETSSTNQLNLRGVGGRLKHRDNYKEDTETKVGIRGFTDRWLTSDAVLFLSTAYVDKLIMRLLPGRSHFRYCHFRFWWYRFRWFYFQKWSHIRHSTQTAQKRQRLGLRGLLCIYVKTLTIILLFILVDR